MKRIILAGAVALTAALTLGTAFEAQAQYDRGDDDDRPRRYQRGYDEDRYERRRYREDRHERGGGLPAGRVCVTARGNCMARPAPYNAPCGCEVPGFGFKRGAIGG